MSESRIVSSTKGSCMRRLILLYVVLLQLAMTAGSRAGIVAELLEQQFPADSKEYGGDIHRPRICPVDSNWVAFEVHSQDQTKLYIYNAETRKPHQLEPRVSEGDINDDIIARQRIDRDLAWRPAVTKDGGIWAVFVSNVTGAQDLYLFEVKSGKYYLLLNAEDSLGTGKRMRPSWSPDGRCLTYTSTHRGNADIFILRNMEEVLLDPLQPEVSGKHAPLVTDAAGKGNQFGAVWCPAPNAGYIAYVHQPEGEGRVDIRVWDPRSEPGRYYTLDGADPEMQYFSPSWSPSGTSIAFYQGPVGGTTFTEDLGAVGDTFWSDSYGVGFAGIQTRGDSLVIRPKSGGTRQVVNIIDVVPNRDRYLGPAWLADDKNLLLSIYDEPNENPFGIVNTYLWVKTMPRNYWLGSFTGSFGSPSDMSVVRDRIAFTFSQEQKQTLMTARLKLRQPPEPYENLLIDTKRQQWWSDYSRETKAGFFKKAGRFFLKPIAGPDLVINRGIVPVSAGVVLLAMAIGGGDDGGKTPPLPPSRDWTPPDFPTSVSIAKGFKIRLTF